VRAAYRELVKVWHPDRFANDPICAQRPIDGCKTSIVPTPCLQDATGPSNRHGNRLLLRASGHTAHDADTALALTRHRASAYQSTPTAGRWRCSSSAASSPAPPSSASF
jgi:hypothetical protein